MYLNKLFELNNTSLLENQEQKVLLASSGGVDSMVLADLFIKFSISFAIAHCNFKLRGKESDSDEEFLKKYAHNNNISFFSKQFDTLAYSNEHKIGIQEAARNLRYKWFEEIRVNNAFDLIATAHHANDQAESVLHRLIRGTGLVGASGIPKRNGVIVRPLLEASKREILNYAENHSIQYREDASNQANDYTRNKIRNTVLPRLEEINTSAVQHLAQFSERSAMYQVIVNEHIHIIKQQCVMTDEFVTTIDFRELIDSPACSAYFFELLHPYGFNTIQINVIEKAVSSKKSGITFQSKTHQLFVSRNKVEIFSNQQLIELQKPIEYSIDKLPFTCSYLGNSFSFFSAATTYNASEDALMQLIDITSFGFPIKLRKWKSGDTMIPIGMNSTKKVSDLLIDRKFSKFEKEATLVLTNRDHHIIAVLPHIISESAKVQPQSSNIVKVICNKKGG